jgi:hypothetical protein
LLPDKPAPGATRSDRIAELLLDAAKILAEIRLLRE